MRQNLKEAVGKSPVRRTEITYKARNADKSATKDKIRGCQALQVNVADIWGERTRTLIGEVSQAAQAVVTTNCEKSAEAIVVRKLL